MVKITSKELYDCLCKLNLETKAGIIRFTMAGVTVQINTTDTVGITLQAWVKQYLEDNGYYFSEPENTQEFPDFFLDDVDQQEHMLEIKAFNYEATPAFDIANFESYCSSVAQKPYRLDADYLIFGYTMNEDGVIYVKKIWLHKIWEIAGDSKRFPLKTQVKRDMIYNIRPNSNFKCNQKGPFKSKEAFLKAIYDTLVIYKGRPFANNWKEVLVANFRRRYGHIPF